MLASALAVGSIAFASPQRVIDSGLVVLVRTVGGEVGNGIVVGTNEVATSCSVLAGAAAITVHETWKAPVARPAEGVPAILAARDEEGRACLLFLEEPFWRSPPVEFAPVSPSGSAASGVRAHQQVFTVSVAEGNILTVRRGLMGTPSNPVDREAAASLASHPDPRPAADHSATPLGEAGTAFFDERGRLLAMTALLPPARDRGDKGVAGGSEPPTRIWVPARDIAALLDSSADWRACLASPTPDCVLDEAERIAIESGWGAEGVTAAWRDLGDREGASAFLRESAAALLASGRAEPRQLLAAASGLIEAGDEPAALRTLAAAKSAADAQWDDDAYWRIDFFGGLASALVRAGAVGAAADLADEALRLVNDEDGRDRTLGGAAVVQVSAGQVRAAVGTAQMIAEAEKRRYVIGKMSRALLESGDLDGARWIAEQVKDSEYRAYLLRQVVAALVERGDVERARQIAADHSLAVARTLVEPEHPQAVLEAALQMEDSWRRVGVVRSIAYAQAEAGDFGAALGTAEHLRAAAATPPDAYVGLNTCEAKPYCGTVASVARIMAAEGKVEAALALHERLDLPRERLLVLVDVAATKEAQGDAAVRTALSALSDAVELDHARDLEDVAVAQAVVGDYVGAEFTLQRIATAPWDGRWARDEVDDPEFKSLRTDGALARTARAQAGAGNFDEALRTANRVGSGFSRLSLLVDVAEAQVAARETRAAQATFAEAVGLFERISSVPIRPRHGGTHPLVWALEAITHAQAKAGLGDQALETFGRMENPERKASFALQKIVHAACSRGEFGLALRAQSVMSSWRTEALGYIARGLAGLPPGDLPHRID